MNKKRETTPIKEFNFDPLKQEDRKDLISTLKGLENGSALKICTDKGEMVLIKTDTGIVFGKVRITQNRAEMKIFLEIIAEVERSMNLGDL